MALQDPPYRIDLCERVLEATADAQNALAIWRRPVPPALASAIAGLDLTTVADLDFKTALPVDAVELEPKLLLADYPARAAHHLARDIAELARFVVSTGHFTHLRIRLEVVETDACRKFHADYVARRLLTTYIGQGTQWMAADDPDTIRQMETGDVGIFKGRLLLEQPPILHRSPPIQSAGGESVDRRLLLAIDPADLV